MNQTTELSLLERPVPSLQVELPALDTRAALPSLIVVGHGMVGQRFCERAVELRLNHSHDIVLYGEEPFVAYDRVHLTKLLHGSPIEELMLRPRQWYADNRISLFTNVGVERLDLERRLLWAGGVSRPFDKLVLATGSRALRPKLPGSERDEVLVYRTAGDLLSIVASLPQIKRAGRRVVVVGAGLLGLEAAAALMDLGVPVKLIEAADYLLPRQLDRVAASRVGEMLRERGFDIAVGIRVSEIEKSESGLQVRLTNGDTVAAGLVVLAMGVRPRDELARDVGIRCDLFGGIEIDECLQTSASNVYAIGECARYKGYNYGLVAPGYAMAEALAEHLAGGSVRFAGAEQNTRLKVSGVELNVIGESNTDDVESRIVTAEDGASFRRLVVRNQRIVGATVVGPWDEMGALQDAVVRRTPLKERQERRFRARKPVWPQGPVPLAMWPDPAVVCTCTGTTCGTLRRLRADGATTVAELRQRTGASSVCGTCEPLLQTLVSGKVSVPGRIAYVTLSAAIVSLLLVLATVVSPPLGFATATSDTFQLDQLWRESLYKQITGFTLLGVVALETIISVRKRWARFQIGRFTSWRAFHTVMGALLLLGLVAHTGFRLGHHLDRWLVSFLLLSTAVGGGAAILAALETRYASPSVMTLRRWLAGAHLWLLWPLPVLIAAHVIKVYFF